MLTAPVLTEEALMDPITHTGKNNQTILQKG